MSSIGSTTHTVAPAHDERTPVLLQERECGDGWKVPIVRMNLFVLECVTGILAVVLQIHVHGHHVDGLWELDPVWFQRMFIPLKVRRLVHVQPNAGKRQHLV